MTSDVGRMCHSSDSGERGVGQASAISHGSPGCCRAQTCARSMCMSRAPTRRVRASVCIDAEDQETRPGRGSRHRPPHLPQRSSP